MFTNLFSSVISEIASLSLLIRETRIEIEKIADDRDSLARTIEFLEWGHVPDDQNSSNPSTIGVCPVCRQGPEQGHADGCFWGTIYADGVEALAETVATRPGYRTRTAL